MKKFKAFLAVSLAAVLTFGLCACEKAQELPSTSTSVSASTEASVSTETSVTTPEPEPAKEYVETPILVYEDEGYTVYVVKGDEKVGSYRIGTRNIGEARFTHGDYIFLREYKYDDEYETEGNKYAYKAYNYKTGEETLLTMGEWNGCIDIYKGKVIVTVFNYYAGEYQEYCFDEKTLEPAESELGDFLADIPEAYNNIVFLNYINYLEGFSIERFLDEMGYIRVRKDGKIYNYDGEAVNEFDEICDEDKENFNLLYFNEECVVYETYDGYDYSHRRLVDQSLITGRRTVITSTFGYISDIEDGVLYFTENEDGEYGLYSRSLYKYDVKEHMKEKLSTRKSYPGTYGELPFGDVIASDGTVYAVTNDGVTGGWSVLINGDFKQIGVGTKTYTHGDNVSIDYVSDTVKCKFCGETIGCYYGEYAILGAGYGDKVDAINKTLKEYVENDEEDFLAMEPYFSAKADECEENMHGLEMGMVTYDLNVSRAFKINDKYVTVESSAYWYGGGAHGYPFIIPRLFDMTTGEQVAFTDIYTGTEEDLKKVVAKATQEYAASFEEDNTPFYASDPESIYAVAYDLVSLETITVTYYKDGLYVEYAPYDMGPYAAGFIEVFVPYKDLGITAFD